jgi:hypothetical protein
MPRHWRTRIYKLNKNKRVIRYKVPAAAALAVVVAVGAVFAFGNISGGGQPNGGQSAEDAAKEYYQSQVDTDTGEPISGRDPAGQSQGSLASAASNPTGAGQRIENPASGINGGQNPSGAPNQSGNGINSSGCFYEYGTPGGCIQAHLAPDGKLTCQILHANNYHNGVPVSNDRFALDTNKDGTACGIGD